MYIEIQMNGKKKQYYLTHSFRDGAKVRKIRHYLGADIKKADIDKLRKDAEEIIKDQIENYKKISDPFNTVLSEKEMEILNNLIVKSQIKIEHLSPKDWKDFTQAFTYNTNAIEGSTLSEGEVNSILEKNQWPEDKSKWELSETYGVAEAVEHIRKTKEHLSLDLIKNLHKICFHNSKKFAGEFRKKGEEVVVVNGLGEIIHRGAPPTQVLNLMNDLIAWYAKNRKKYHPSVLAAVVHNQFENIHPFIDGNGRIGRLLLNNILIKHKLPPINIRLENRQEYYQSLQTYGRFGDIKPTIKFLIKEYRQSKK